MVDALFHIEYAEPRSNRYIAQQRAIVYWRDYLQDCEANDAEASIEEVLVFVTGASRPPPLGFDEPTTITFLDDEPFAMANTCANTIRIPVCYSEYEEFKRKMVFAIKNSPCFGYA